MIPDNLPALKKSEQQMSMEMETLFRNFQQFSQGVMHPWETVLEMDEDAEDGSIIWTRKVKLFLNEKGKEFIKNRGADQTHEDKNEWKFYQSEEAMQRDALKRRKDMILQNGRYSRQFDKTSE